ncbi:MAG TPA: hypothetical protein VG122_18345 [Gemmata sp.]|nr:hypothetical protein [Gemmata sp.]
MSSSYDVLAAIDMEGVAGHAVGGGTAQRGDAARNVLWNRQALVRIALACDLDFTSEPGAGLTPAEVQRLSRHTLTPTIPAIDLAGSAPRSESPNSPQKQISDHSSTGSRSRLII